MSDARVADRLDYYHRLERERIHLLLKGFRPSQAAQEEAWLAGSIESS